MPAGLHKSSAGLNAFIDLFELDSALIMAAAQASHTPQDISQTQLRQAIEQLSPDTRNAWLLRLAQLTATFQRELLKSMRQAQSDPPSRRTVGDLLAIAKTIEEAERIKQVAAAKAKHLKKMEKLALQESRIWQEVFDLIDRKTGKGYDEAVTHLKNLHDLAKYQQNEAQFQARLNKIYLDYRNRPALLKRLRKGGLYEQ